MPEPVVIKPDQQAISGLIPNPPVDMNKYSRGTVGIVGGCAAYPGAPVLSALASARSGAGYTRLVTVESAASCARAHLLSVPVTACVESPSGTFCDESLDQVRKSLSKSKTILVGPGMGTSQEASSFLGALLAAPELSGSSIVLDADALNLIAQSRDLLLTSPISARVLTPHEGEASRLLQRPLEDRCEDACIIANMFMSTVLLKGSDTIIATPQNEVYLIDEGGPELAKAGSGDVLGGMIAAFLSQGLTSCEAALLGAFIHARAGKLSARKLSVHAVMPEDIINEIGPALLDMEA